MPYASDKQRRFMHARHPKIAARWDAEIRKKRRKKKVKRKKGSKKTKLKHDPFVQAQFGAAPKKRAKGTKR